MINALITSKTRLKLLLKFFLNPGNSAHLRGLESEFGESSNAIRVELNRLRDANMLVSEQSGNRKMFRVNSQHPLYSDINSIVKKYFGLDKVVNNVVSRLGDLQSAWLTGDISRGKDSGIIDLILVGKVDVSYLVSLIQKVESLIERKVRYLVYSPEEMKSAIEAEKGNYLCIWDVKLSKQEQA